VAIPRNLLCCKDLDGKQGFASSVADDGCGHSPNVKVYFDPAKGGVKPLPSEDLNSGQTVTGVLIENPFAAIP
jgi:hypothetical protein